MSALSWKLPAVTTLTDLVVATSATTISNLLATNTTVGSATFTVTVTDAANAILATLVSNGTLTANTSIQLGGVVLNNGDKLRVTSSASTSFIASGWTE